MRRECLAKGCDCAQYDGDTQHEGPPRVCSCAHRAIAHRYRSMATPAPVRRTPRVRRVTR